MQIHKIMLQNFKQYKYEEIEFPDGLIGFIGKNGAGKSTIFEAISNAFYGKFETNKDLVRNDKASTKDHVKIELRFEDKGKNFKVVREYRASALTAKADLYRDDEHLASGSREVDKQIRRIIKIDYYNFKNSFFAHQKDVTSLMNLGIKDRQESFRKMLGLERLDKLEIKIKEEVKEQNIEIRAKQGELLTDAQTQELKESSEAKDAEIKTAKEKVEAQKKIVAEGEKAYQKIKTELNKLEKQKSENDKLLNKIEVQDTEIANNAQNLKDSNNELKELKEGYELYKKLLPKKNEYEKFSKRISELQEIKTKYNQKLNLQKTIATNERKLSAENEKLKLKESELKSYDDVETNTSKLDDSLISERELLKSFIANKDTLNKLVGSFADQINKKKQRMEKIENIGRDSDCPECERPLGDHYDNLLNKYKSEISELESKAEIEQNNLDELNSKISAKEKTIDNLNDDLSDQKKRSERKEAIKESITDIKKVIVSINEEVEAEKNELAQMEDVKFSEEELSEVQSKAVILKPDYERCLSLASKGEEIPKKEEEIKNLNIRKTKLQEGLTLLKKELDDLKFDNEEYIKIKNSREKKEEELNELKEIYHLMEKELSSLDHSLKEIKTKLKANEELQKRIEVLEKEKDLYEKLKRTVTVFKENITSRELPEISREASNLFTSITKGRYFNLRIDDQFNFVVTRDDKEVELNTLSGGEKDLASLCLRIAISKRISKLAGRSNMGFLALDEVFGSQDEDRREELLNALNEISKDFRQIFVVSHNQDVQEEFPNRLLISKVGDYSTAEMVS